MFLICLIEFAGQGQRGKTTMLGMRKANPSNALKSIRFEAGAQRTYKPVGENHQQFASLVGTIVDRFPQNYKSWSKVPAHLKSTIWTELRVKFLIILFNVKFFTYTY